MLRDDGPHVPSKAVYFLVVPGFAAWEAAHALAELRRHGGYQVQVVGFTREPVQSMGGVTVQPTRSLAEVDPADVSGPAPRAAAYKQRSGVSQAAGTDVQPDGEVL